MRRLPALDGLRGLAVLAVVVYHLAPDRMPGGFLGVSVFFMLSGFLITSLLLAESTRTGRIGLGAFWGRRFRRLLPAALLALAVAVAVAAVVGDPHQLQTLPGDVVSAVAYLTNWHFISQGVAYGAQYQQPSVVQHFWSLAIEEQFYIGVAVLAFLLARFSASRRTWALVFGALALGSVAATLVMGPSDQVGIYYSTITRAFELLAGSLLAIAVAGHISSPGGTERSRSVRRALDIAGAVALLALVAAFVVVHLEDAIVYRGGLWIVAGLTLVVLVAIRSTGWMARALSWRPLVLLGVVSYGVYVFHWPLFILISDETMGGPAWLVPVVRLAATAVCTALSYVLVEQPVRLRRWALPPARVIAALSVSVIVLVGASIAIGGQSNNRAVVAAPDIALSAPVTVATAPTPATIAPPVPATWFTRPDPNLPIEPSEAPDAIRYGMIQMVSDTFAASGRVFSPEEPPRPISGGAPRGAQIERVVLMGDSMLQDAFPAVQSLFAAQDVQTFSVGGPAQSILYSRGRWLVDLQQVVEDQDPDVVVLESCCGTEDAVVLPTGREAFADDPAYWVAWEAMVNMATDIASSRGARVMWVIPPPADGATSRWYGDIQARMGQVAEIGHRIVQERPQVQLVDWSVFSGPDGGYSATMPDRSGHDVTVRARDGVHFSPAGQALQAQATVDQILNNWTLANGRAG